MLRTQKRWGIVVAAVVALAPSAAAEGATIEVTLRGDPAPGNCTPSHCSLREAVLRANNVSPGSDTIVLPNRRRPYKLAIANADSLGEDGSQTGDLDVTNDPLTIKHPGKGVATVDGGGLDRVFHLFAPLTLKRIGVTDGDSSEITSLDDGGGILTYARLKLLRSQVSGNIGDHGGGIAALEGSRLTIARSRIAGNTDTDGGGGLHILSADPSSISNSVITGNRVVNTNEAGAINVFGTQLRISRTTIAGNSSQREGGAIVAQESDLRVENSTISRNRGLGRGGGIYLYSGETRIVNSTIAQNRTTEDGGGIVVLGDGQLDLNGVTISRNLANSDSNPFSETGGGLSHDSTGAVTVRNSILALNTLGPDVRNDCTGNPIASGGGNLLSTLGPVGVCTGFAGPGDAVRSNPGLGKLAKNGGPTKTMALKGGSPAIGRARSSAPARDQRGVKRDRSPDSGAYER